MPDPPETERREVVETLHGEEIRDPYRWLEADTEAVAAWVERQNDYADERLRTDARERLGPRMEARAEVADYGVVTARERGYFQRVEAPEDDRAKLVFRSSLDADSTVLADPNEWDADESLDWYSPSPDGSLAAYGVAEGGQEQYDVHVLDVETGETVDVLRDCGRTGPRGMAWTDSGFYYAATGSLGDGGQLDKELRHHELGTDADADPVLTDEISEHVWPQLEIDDGTLVVAYHEGGMRSEVYRWEERGGDSEAERETEHVPDSAGGRPPGDRPRGDGELVPILADADALFAPRVSDGELFVLTNYDAPHSRIVACDIDASDVDPDDLREVVPEREATLEECAFAGEYLVVHYQRDAHSSLTVYDREGEQVREVDLPEYSAVGRDDLRGHPDAPEAFVRAQSFDRPPWVSRVDAETGETAVVNERGEGDARDGESAPDDPDLVIDQRFFESADGTEIPAFVVHREGIELDGDNPTVLYGYGGFQLNLTPQYDRFRMAFLEDGGVYVRANLRGGAEYGEEWHRSGMRERKQNVFDDFFGVAEGLIDAGYTRPEKLAAMGRSNGGLLVGAAITQRPDLFGAASCGVPLLDMLRFHRFLLGESWTTEYGSPEDPDDFAYLRAYSPYHNVEAVEYPATLFETAAGDTRVHPGHARKMTARMQAANRSTNPVLLRSETGTGHGVGKPTSMLVAEHTDRWAFLYDQLGVLE